MRLLFEKEAYELLHLFSRYFSNTCASVSEPPPMKSVHVFALALFLKNKKTLWVSPEEPGPLSLTVERAFSSAPSGFAVGGRLGKWIVKEAPALRRLGASSQLGQGPLRLPVGDLGRLPSPLPSPSSSSTAAEERGWLGRGTRGKKPAQYFKRRALLAALAPFEIPQAHHQKVILLDHRNLGSFGKS